MKKKMTREKEEKNKANKNIKISKNRRGRIRMGEGEIIK